MPVPTANRAIAQSSESRRDNQCSLENYGGSSSSVVFLDGALAMSYAHSGATGPAIELVQEARNTQYVPPGRYNPWRCARRLVGLARELGDAGLNVAL